MLAKVILLGAWLASFGTMVYLWFTIYRKLPSGQAAVGVNVFSGYTTQNPVWWLGLVVCFVVAFMVVRAWPGNRFVWATLAITELVPVGLLVLFLMIVARLRQAAGR